MVFGGRIDELEGKGRRAGHYSEGAGEITGEMGERQERSKDAFLLTTGKI